jgi:D-xylose 1-dehydrogenase (NADP+, D-xylono-1,5-lactone-forming)
MDRGADMKTLSTGKVRWGILGCADIALSWMIPAIQASETGIVAAIASRDVQKARNAAEAHRIPRFFGSYEEMLASDEIDAVYIPLPNHLHYEWTLRAAEAGKHVLCEKPFSIDARQAEEMAKACDRAGVLLAEAFMYRHHPRYARVKDIVASGEIGEIRGLHAAFTFDITNRVGDIRFQSALGGGAFYDDGCYPISAVRYLVGKEPEAVTFHSYVSPEHDNVDMMNSGLIEFPDGIGATLQFGMWSDYTNEIRILGSHGSITIPTAFYYDPPAATGILVKARNVQREESYPALNHYIIQTDDFGRCVLGEQPARFKPEDAVSNMRVLEACIRSAKERRRVAL